ncbi:MAG: hypothetical protein IAE99_10920 [Rhodothermales bacterium]|nr:hypothetical protein [Rhodothermales bacterium]
MRVLVLLALLFSGCSSLALTPGLGPDALAPGQKQVTATAGLFGLSARPTGLGIGDPPVTASLQGFGGRLGLSNRTDAGVDVFRLPGDSAASGIVQISARQSVGDSLYPRAQFVTVSFALDRVGSTTREQFTTTGGQIVGAHLSPYLTAYVGGYTALSTPLAVGGGVVAGAEFHAESFTLRAEGGGTLWLLDFAVARSVALTAGVRF